MPAPRDDHECQLRRRFTSKQHAQAAVLRIAQAQGKQRYPLACRFCNGYHLSESQ